MLMPRRRQRQNRSAYGVPVPEALHHAVEVERDNLLKAESVLACLSISMQYRPQEGHTPNYADVADVAREMIRTAVGNLDSLKLEKLLARNKIAEARVVVQYVGGKRSSSLTPEQEYPITVERLYPLLHRGEPGTSE
jgi:hypothetical protein